MSWASYCGKSLNGDGVAGAAMVTAGLAAVMFVVPSMVTTFGLLELTILVVMAIFALSEGFIWGFAGIMSFGQAAFFGLGGYAYAVTALNMGDSTLAALVAIAAP